MEVTRPALRKRVQSSEPRCAKPPLFSSSSTESNVRAKSGLGFARRGLERCCSLPTARAVIGRRTRSDVPRCGAWSRRLIGPATCGETMPRRTWGLRGALRPGSIGRSHWWKRRLSWRTIVCRIRLSFRFALSSSSGIVTTLASPRLPAAVFNPSQLGSFPVIFSPATRMGGAGPPGGAHGGFMTMR